MTVRTPFLVVFAAQRTGSNYLCDLLSAREGVTSVNEVFNKNSLGLSDEVRKRRLTGVSSWDEYARLAFADRLKALSFIDDLEDTRLVVVKIQPQQVSLQRSLEDFVATASGHIFLRRNPLSVWVSRAQALQTGSWSNTPTERIGVTFDGDDFARYALRSLTKLNRIEKTCRRSGAPTTTITYSQLLDFSNPETLWNDLYGRFPALDHEPIRATFVPSFSKQDHRPPVARLSNVDEALLWLEKRGLSHLIDNRDDFDANAIVTALRDSRARRQAAD